MILLRILAGTRASIGRVTDKKTWLGCCVPGSKFCSPDREARTDWTPSWTAGTSTVSLVAACPWTCWMLDPEDCKEVDSSTGSDTAGAWDDVEGGLCACWAIELNLKAMAATAWSLPLLPATPADPLQVKLKWCAGLLLVLQEVAGIAQGTRLLLVTQVVLPRIHAEGRVAGLSMTSCHQQPNSVSWHAAEGRRPKPPGPGRMAAWIAVNDEEASTENKETTST